MATQYAPDPRGPGYWKIPIGPCGAPHAGLAADDCDDCCGIRAWVKAARSEFRWKYHKIAPKVFKRDGRACVLCGSPDDLTIDHIKSLMRGGSNRLRNLRVLCRSCNARKG